MSSYKQGTKPAARTRLRISILCLALVAAVLLVYGRTRTFDFTNYDDDEYVTDNTHVLTGLNTGNVRWALTSFHASNWHPVTWLSHMVDVQVFGVNSARHHLVNVAFHGANSVLLFLLLARITGAFWPSALVAALFGLHPLHVESVAWVSERKDLLSTLFWLLTVGAYARYAEARSKSENRNSKTEIRTRPALWYGVALVLFTVGLMSKPMVVTLPFVLLLLDYWPLQRLQFEVGGSKLKTVLPLLWEKTPFLCLAVISSIVTLMAQQKAMTPYPFGIRLENALVSYGGYVRAMFWPAGLAPIYPHLARHLGFWKVLSAVALIGGITAGVAVGRRRFPYLATGWLWYLGTLVPVIGLIQVGIQARADRYTYIPLIGLFIVVAWGAGDIARRWSVPRAVVAGGAGVVLAALSIVSIGQVGYWRDSITLFTRTLAVTEGNFQAHCNLGDALAQSGQGEAALLHYREALQIWPKCRSAMVNMGNTLALLHRPREAAACFTRALALDPGSADLLTNLGNTAAEQGQWDEAVKYYRRSIEMAPSNNGDVYVNLGYVLQNQKKFAEAESAFTGALHVNPRNAKAKQALEQLHATSKAGR